MDRRGSTGELTPWSFFIPVALAVALGVVVANALGFVAGAIFPARADAGAAGPVAAAAPGAATPPAAAPHRQSAVAVAAKPLPVLEAVRLPGPTTARRDGESRACINGTIALRAANGWQQEVLGDVPARCIAASR